MLTMIMDMKNVGGLMDDETELQEVEKMEAYDKQSTERIIRILWVIAGIMALGLCSIYLVGCAERPEFPYWYWPDYSHFA